MNTLLFTLLCYIIHFVNINAQDFLAIMDQGTKTMDKGLDMMAGVHGMKFSTFFKKNSFLKKLM